MYAGHFWAREYTSDADLSSVLTYGHIDVPLKHAFVDACLAVENSDTLASVFISTIAKGYRIEAVHGNKRHVVMTQRCEKCATVMYGSHHLFNGCDDVIVDEVMNS